MIALPEQSLTKQATASVLQMLPGSLLESLKSAVLKSIACALADEAERLERISVQPNCKVDFYDEVRRFECNLIERAMILAGNQKRAAAMLGLNTTTLNSKIKLYNIDLKVIPQSHVRRSPTKTTRTKDQHS